MPTTQTTEPLKNQIKWDDRGLVVAIIQDYESGRVLMVGYMNEKSLDITLREKRACFWSRSRQVIWRKGETSGNILSLRELRVDCDADALLLRCDAAGPTCHTEARSCFDAEPGDEPATSPQDFAWLERLWAVIDERARERPDGSYTTKLLDGGVDASARKVAEEATEVVMAAKDDDVAERAGAPRPREALAGELADLLYHSLVLCAERGLPPSEVIETLKDRHRA